MANIVLRSASHIGEPVIFMLEEVRMCSSLTMANIMLRSSADLFLNDNLDNIGRLVRPLKRVSQVQQKS